MASSSQKMPINIAASLPPGFLILIGEFTVAVLRERPEDLKKFAMEFFNDSRDKSPLSTGLTPASPSADGKSNVGQSVKKPLNPSKQILLVQADSVSRTTPSQK